MNSLGANGNGFNRSGRGPSDAIAFPNIYQTFGSQAQTKVQQIQSNLTNWAQSQAGNALSPQALLSIYQVQADLIINKSGEYKRLFENN
jgi:choline dehydrogenase